MNDLLNRNLEKATLSSMTEKELAKWRLDQGKHIIVHRNRYWKEAVKGFYEPIDLMANLSPEQVAKPNKLSWGFRASLSEEGVSIANGSIPLYLLSNLTDYGLQSLSSNRRTQLKKCRKNVKILALKNTKILQEQGYQVFLSSAQRVGMKKIPSQQLYLANLAEYKPTPFHIILAGMINDRLGGYVTGYAVNGTAYLEYLYIQTELLKTNISLGLTFDFIQVCKHSGSINKIIHGQHRRENSSLCAFKESLGFNVKYIPSHVSINPLVSSLLRWRYPHKYYRLTGQV